jgi:hypothetical protein
VEHVSAGEVVQQKELAEQRTELVDAQREAIGSMEALELLIK